MGTQYCKITPSIKSKDGVSTPSKLHADLNAWTDGDRKKQNNIWATTRTSDFIQKYDSVLERDFNGEYVASDVIGKTSIKDELSDEEIISGLNSEPLATRQVAEPVAVHSLLNQVQVFNERSPFSERIEAALAVNDGVAKVAYSPVDSDTLDRRNRLAASNGLYTKMSQWLERNGISIGALTDAERGQGIDAVTDFSALQRAANGMVELVRIADGERGRNALTEEAAHIAVRALKGKDANVDRVLSMLEGNEAMVRKVLGNEFDEYSHRYQGDASLMAEEAAGKILKSQIQEGYEAHLLPTHKSLIRRMADAILNFFRRSDRHSLEALVESANQQLSAVADRMLSDESFEPFDFDDMAQQGDKLFAVTQKVRLSIQDYLQKLIQQTDSEVKLTRRQGKKAQKRTLYKESMLSDLLDKRQKGEYIQGIGEFLNSMAGDLNIQLSKWASYKWESMSNDTKAQVIDKCITLKDTYSNVLEDYFQILTNMEEDPNADKDELKAFADLKEVCQEARNAIDDLARKAIAKSLPSVVEFANQFAETSIVVPFGEAYGRKEGESVEFADTLLHEDKDIAWYDLWLASGAMSNSFNVQILAKIINTLQVQIRDEAIDYNKRLKDLTLHLEEAGVTDQDFMYERDDNGELTGKFIKTDSEAYKKLDPLRKKYHDDVMEIKKELDNVLPPYVTSLVNAPKVRKDFLEVLKNSKGDQMKVIKDKLKETYSMTSDDEYTLKNDVVIIDYNGNQVHTVPLRFLSFGKDENMNNMSTDIVESMSLYAQMATNFSMMTRALPHLRNALNIIKEGSVGKEGEEEIGDKKFKTQKGLKKRGEQSKEVKRIEGMFDSQLYGMKVYDLNVGNVSLTKIGHNLMQWTALNQYAMNPHGALQNEITGIIQEATEAMAGKYFSNSDLVWAHQEYVRCLPDIVGETGARAKNSKINLFIEKLNILQESDREQNFNRKTRLGRLVNSQLPYCMTGVGEHNLHTLTGLAMANNIKLKDANGNQISLWDALETITLGEQKTRQVELLIAKGEGVKAQALKEKIDKHPEWFDGKTLTLAIKKGVTKTNGEAFTDEDLQDQTRRIMAVNHRLHGIYNEEDKALAQQYVLGQMGMMYRKWMAPSIFRRFQGLTYSQDLHDWEEGYYRTAARLLRETILGIWNEHSVPKRDLKPLERENIRRCAFEMGLWLVFLGAKILLNGVKKKKERTYAFHVLNYFVTRTSSELNAYVPFGVPIETMRLLQSPTAVLSTSNNLLNFLYTAVNPLNYETFNGENAVLKSGPHKGQSRVENAFWKSGIPLGYHQLDGVMHLDEKVKFYQ